MSTQAFQAYWLGRHPEVVTKLPGLRRYVQSHTRTAAYPNGAPMYDGIAELWFDDSGATRALRDTPEMAAVHEDEARFIDRSTMGLIITDEHVVKDGPVPAGARSADVKRASPAISAPRPRAGSATAERINKPVVKEVPSVDNSEELPSDDESTPEGGEKE